MEPDEIILPEEGSSAMFEQELDELYGRKPKEETCTGASSASASLLEACKESRSS
jgi:hypothetical protein